MIQLKNTPLKLLLALFILIQPIFWTYHFYSMGRSAIYISVVGPEKERNSYVKAVRLYLKTLNRNGGIGGKELVLREYDDHGDPEQAVEIARKIATDDMSVAVIGHSSDACTAAAGEIYAEAGIPMISPSSMGKDTVAGSEWLYRTIFDESLQYRFIAHYMENVFYPKSVLIVHQANIEYRENTRVFEDTITGLGIEIKKKFALEPTGEDQAELFEQVVSTLENDKETDMPVVLITEPEQGADLIRGIKDNGLKNPIMTPVSFTTPGFIAAFRDLPKERMHPGFYTDGIYAISPFLFELGNEESQNFQEAFYQAYSVEPDWEAAYAIDAAKIIIQAMEKFNIAGRPETLKEDRLIIRNFLDSLSSVKDSIEGTTGLNFFDDDGNSFKPVAFGIYEGNRLIPAPYQFQIVKDTKEIQTLEIDLEEGRVVKVGDEYFHKTAVIHTGIDILEVGEFDEENLVFKTSFFLWFRYHLGDVDISSIEFLNSVEPIKLKAPETEEIIDKSVYRRYKVEGVFRADFVPADEYLGHVLGVTFRHKTQTRKELLFIKDELGMYNKKRARQKEQNMIQNSLFGWNIVDSTFFQDVSNKRTWGNIKYIDHKEKSIEHSRFTAKIQIERDSINPRLSVPSPYATYLTLINIVVLLLVILLLRSELPDVISRKVFPRNYRKKKKRAGFFYSMGDGVDQGEQYDRILKKKRKQLQDTVVKFSTLLQIVFSFSLLLLLETAVIHTLMGITSTSVLDKIYVFFNVLWWITPAKLLNDMIQMGIFDRLEEKSERKVPGLVRGFTTFFIYLMASFGIIAFVFNFKITGLVATSGILMMIIGLAIQLNIANVFSGIAINLERPYLVGDWVKVGNFAEGRVIDVNWRTTRFEDKLGCIFAIPNATIAESFIYNYSLPSDQFNDWISVYIDPEQEPMQVTSVLLKAVFESGAEILTEPAPWASLSEINNSSAVYLVGWSARNILTKYSIRQQIWLSIWNHLKKAGIKPGIQRHAVQVHQDEVIELPKK